MKHFIIVKFNDEVDKEKIKDMSAKRTHKRFI